MNRTELEQRLKVESVPDDTYCLDGGLPNDRYCVEKNLNGWEVYYSELGTRYEVRVFTSEQEAFDNLYERLMEMMKAWRSHNG